MTDYIKKADAYRIAVHGTDPDVAYKIQQLEPEKVVPAEFIDVLREELWQKSKIGGRDGVIYGNAATALTYVAGLWKMISKVKKTGDSLTGAEKCDKVEVEE